MLYHGNAGSACYRSLYAELFAEAGYGTIVVKYSGYGGDPLLPRHERVKHDVANIVAFLESRSQQAAVVVGESIGSGPAALHATSHSAERPALLLLSPFTSINDLARARFWFYPTSFLVENAYDNRAVLSGYPGPALIVHGENDRVVPTTMGRTLYEGFSGPADILIVPGAGHNDPFSTPTTHTAIVNFLKNLQTSAP